MLLALIGTSLLCIVGWARAFNYKRLLRESIRQKVELAGRMAEARKSQLSLVRGKR